MVKIDIVENNKEVPVVLNAKGTPPEDVVIDGLESEQKTVKLFGPSKVLDEIEEFVVDVDVSKVSKSETVDIEMSKPKGVSEIGNKKIKVDIKTTVANKEAETDTSEEADSEEVAVNGEQKESEEPNEPNEPNELDEQEEVKEEESVMETKKIDDIQVVVNGLNDNYTSTFVKPENGLLTLIVTGNSSIMKNINKSSFSISVDASKVDAEGEQVYPVMVKGPENVSWTVSSEEVTMNIEAA